MFIRCIVIAGLVASLGPGMSAAGPRGCPPGLAKKAIPCVPPGQAKKWGMRRAIPFALDYEVLDTRTWQRLGLRPPQMAPNMLWSAIRSCELTGPPGGSLRPCRSGVA